VGSKLKKIRRPGRRKRRNHCWPRLIPLFLALLALLYLFLEHRHEGARKEARQFLEHLKKGNLEEAASLTGSSETEADTMGLGWMLEEGLLEISKTGSSRLAGWDQRRVEAIFYRKGEEKQASLIMENTEDGWEVASFSGYSFLWGGLITRDAYPDLEVYYRGEHLNFDISGRQAFDPPFKAGEAIVLAELDGKVVYKDVTEPVSLSRIIKRTGSKIEGEQEGSFDLHPQMSIYRREGEEGGGKNSPCQGQYSDLLVGRNGSQLFLWEDQVVAALVEGEYLPDNIRVALNDSTMENLTHGKAVFKTTAPLKMEEKKSGRKYNFTRGKTFSLRGTAKGLEVDPEGHAPLEFEERVFFNSKEGMEFSNLDRQGWENGPVYPGTLEVEPRDGELMVVNDLPLEKYLRTVVPSEMPARFDNEALKAQAIAARSYAYRAMLDSSYGVYGAHLDDSVSSQVYHNYRAEEEITRAIEATEGKVPFYQGEPVDTRFFSTSWGHTASFEEVWSDIDGGFPGSTVPYLQAASQVPGETLDFSSEEQVRKFLERSPEEAYDYHSPFFRWSVEMTREELEASLEKHLPRRHEHQPSYVLTRQGDAWVSREIPEDPIGELKDLRVAQRGKGGNMMTLDLEGSRGSYRLVKEYHIRHTLRPVQYLEGEPPVELQLHREGSREDYPVLPSAFACIDTKKDAEGRLDKVTISGGGNGHGVGMSQYGAKGMAREGFTHEEILEHYYPGIELKYIY